MDPFLHTFCLACHNVWMYCDCVHSYVDTIPEDGTSHDSEGGGESDEWEDGEFPQADADHPYDNTEGIDPNSVLPSPAKKRPDFDEYWNDPSWSKPPTTPNRPAKKPDSKPTPSGVDKDHVVLTDKPKPMAGDPGPNVPTLPPQSGYTYKPWDDVIEDNLKKRPGSYQSPKRPPKKQDPKPTPSKVPPTDDPSTIALRYFQPATGRPYPFLTSPDINKIVDNYNMPIYTGPMNPVDESWNNFLNDELWPWYDSLPNEGKQLYLDACFTSDPQDGVQSGDGPYFHVSIKYGDNGDNRKRNAEFTYIITPLDGSNPDGYVVLSDYRLPPRAFNNKESIDKYFMKDEDGDYIPRYKSEVNRAGRRDPFFDSDPIGERFALKPNYDGSADVQPTLPTIDPSLPPDPLSDIKPHPSTLNVKFFSNAYGNTDALNGIGYKDVYSVSGFFEPLFNAGYVNMSIWKTTSDKGTPLGYPIGNVPNLTGMSGLISPSGLRGVSSAYGVISKGITSDASIHIYGYQAPISQSAGFSFPCEIVNRYSSGATLYACVWVKTKVIDWVPNNNLHYNMRVEKAVAGTYYYPAVYQIPIKVVSNGLPRIAIEQMVLLKAENDASDIRVQNLVLNQDFYFCCLLGIPDSDPLMDISRGGKPYIEVRIGGKATVDIPATTSSDFKFEVVEISSLWKDNSTWGEFDFKSTFDGTGGRQAEFPTDFNGDTSTPAYFNRQLCYQTWFEVTPQIRALTGVFRDYALSTRSICGENRLLNDSSNHWKGRKIFWPMCLYFSSNNTNKFIAGCSLDGSDTAVVGAGYQQCKVSFFKCPTNWLPMTVNGTVPPYP